MLECIPAQTCPDNAVFSTAKRDHLYPFLFATLISFQKDARTPGGTRGALPEHCRNQRMHASLLPYKCVRACVHPRPRPRPSAAAQPSITTRGAASIPSYLWLWLSLFLQRDCKPACWPCLPIRLQPEPWTPLPWTPTPTIYRSTLDWAGRDGGDFTFGASEEEVRLRKEESEGERNQGRRALSME